MSCWTKTPITASSASAMLHFSHWTTKQSTYVQLHTSVALEQCSCLMQELCMFTVVLRLQAATTFVLKKPAVSHTPMGLHHPALLRKPFHGFALLQGLVAHLQERQQMKVASEGGSRATCGSLCALEATLQVQTNAETNWRRYSSAGDIVADVSCHAQLLCCFHYILLHFSFSACAMSCQRRRHNAKAHSSLPATPTTTCYLNNKTTLPSVQQYTLLLH
jgi:hypothetical protein